MIEYDPVMQNGIMKYVGSDNVAIVIAILYNTNSENVPKII